MPLTNSKQMLLDAKKGGYAVGAFNAENMEMVKAIIEAAEAMRAPVMIQTTAGTIKYGGSAIFAAIVKAEAERASVPVCLHLDHGNSFELAQECIWNGYTSIMIDGSKESFQKNMELTKKVVNFAHLQGIPVEAELGRVGGKEDDTVDAKSAYTDVKEAVEFVFKTKVDSLAVAIGTAHGFYKEKPVLDKGRLFEIAQEVAIPIVLHGASGISDEDVMECVEKGACKVNFATELRVAYTDAWKKLYQQEPETFDPKAYGKVGMEAVKQLVMDKIKVCGSADKVNNQIREEIMSASPS